MGLVVVLGVGGMSIRPIFDILSLNLDYPSVIVKETAVTRNTTD